MNVNVNCEFSRLKYEQMLSEKYLVETCFSRKSKSYPPKEKVKDLYMRIILGKC